MPIVALSCTRMFLVFSVPHNNLEDTNVLTSVILIPFEKTYFFSHLCSPVHSVSRHTNLPPIFFYFFTNVIVVNNPMVSKILSTMLSKMLSKYNPISWFSTTSVVQCLFICTALNLSVIIFFPFRCKLRHSALLCICLHCKLVSISCPLAVSESCRIWYCLYLRHINNYT